MGDAATIEMPVPVLERLVLVLERLECRAVGQVPAADGLLTKQQVAARLGGRCSVRRAERLVAAGKLKPVTGLGKRTVRFRPADVDRFIADEDRPIGRRRL
jgi:Helix-turn-helix domain